MESRIDTDRKQHIIDIHSYYEYDNSKGIAEKYWEIIVHGTVVTMHEGNIGSEGKETIKQFRTENDAMNFAEKKQQEKIKEGYIKA